MACLFFLADFGLEIIFWEHVVKPHVQQEMYRFQIITYTHREGEADAI